jgi:hypothetical protein
MKLPAIPDPQRYVGLYIYDFGSHVAAGYTAAEISILRGSKAHAHGTAYEIYRATDGGVLELRGVLDRRLSAREAMCFLREDGAEAQRDYGAIRTTAKHSPLPCAVELQLAKLYSFDPPNVTGLSYPAAATTVIAVWLSQRAPDLGDQVMGGIDVHGRLAASEGIRIASCQPQTLLDYHDRTEEEVLESVDRPIQR